MSTKPQAVKLRLEGTLLRPAMSRQYSDGTCSVLMLIAQPGGLPLLAERCFGTGSAASYAASNAAHHMRQGMAVTLFGHHLRLDRWHGEQVLRLDAVDHMTHARPIHHTEHAE